MHSTRFRCRIGSRARLHRGLLASAAVLGLIATVALPVSVRAQAAPVAPAEKTGKDQPVPSAEAVAAKPSDSAAAKKEVETLATVEVTADKVAPFTTRNVDLPRGIDDVQPYYFFDAKSIERTGVTNVEDFLREKLTMSTTANSQDQSFFIGGNPSQTLNLRGLGSGQTLLLVNGRRITGGNLALNGSGSQSNINTIPMGAIDRIEVLPTSASAIYGANAVGGVINIVLKRNYAGGELRTSYRNTFESDAPIRSGDLSYGFTLEGGKTQVMIMTSYSEQKSLLYQDRPIMKAYDLRNLANNGLVSGSFVQAGVPIIRNGATGTPNLVLKPAFGGTTLTSPVTYVPLGITAATTPAALGAALLANAGKVPDTYQIPASNSRSIRGGQRAVIGTPTKLKSLGFTFRRQFTPKLDFNAEFTGSSQQSTRDMTISTSQSVTATAPSNPFTTAVTLTLPWDDPFPVWSNTVSRRFAAGFTYALPRDWRALLDYSWNYTSNAYYSTGVTAGTDVTSALNAGTLNPFVDTTVTEPIDYAKYGGLQSWTGGGGSNEVSARASGPAWRLPGGPILLTVGLLSRQDGYSNGNSYTIYKDFPGKTTANTQTLALGKRQSTRSYYAETTIPLVAESNRLPLIRELNFQFAGRREDFTVRTGTTSVTILPAPATAPPIVTNQALFISTTPSAGFTYRPVKSVMFRVNYAGGFVSPSYSQLMLNPTPSTTPTTISDPKRGNTSYGVTTYSGGDPDLKPELSKSWSAGIVFQPTEGLLKGLRANVQYNLIRKKDNIGTLTAQQFVELERLYPDRVVRATPAAGDPYGVGTITSVSLRSLNLLKSLSETFDVNLSYRKTTSRFGSFDVTGLGTFTNHFTKKTALTTPNVDYAGFTSSGALKFQGNVSVTWDYRQWTAGWTMRYFPKFRVSGPPISTSLLTITSQGSEFVPSQSYSDAFVAYRFGTTTRSRWYDRPLRGVELQVGIINVFNKIPPYDVGSFGSYYYSTWGNIRLQEYRLSLKKPL